MDFNLPTELSELLRQIDRFIDQEIRPLQAQDDNERFFDHRREWARTDFDNGGLPRPRVGGAAAGVQEARRQGRILPAVPARGIRWPGHRQPVDGGHPRSPGEQRAGPVQRPAERAFDRGQLPDHRDAARLRHAGAEGAVHHRAAEARDAHHLRPDRAEPRLRRHPHGDEGGARDAQRRGRLADQRREDVDHRHAHRHALRAVRAHRPARTATRAASPASWCPPARPA